MPVPGWPGSEGVPVDPEHGRLFKIPEIMAITGMPEGTVRGRYHRAQMPFMWKLGAHLVCWENDLKKWMDEQQQATTKIKTKTKTKTKEG